MRLLLLEAAGALIEEHGRESVSLRVIANHLKATGTPVTHTALLAHFDGLDALLKEVAAAWWDDLADTLEQARTAHTDALDQLFAMSAAYVGFAVDHPHRFRLMYDTNLWKDALHEDDDLTGTRLEAGRDRGFASFVDAVTAAQSSGRLARNIPAVRATRLITSLSHGLAMEFIDERLGEGPFVPAPQRRRWQLTHAAELLQLAVRGIGVHARHHHNVLTRKTP